MSTKPANKVYSPLWYAKFILCDLCFTFILQDILRGCFEQVYAALTASRQQCGLNPKNSNATGGHAQDCGGNTDSGNGIESEIGGVSVECRQSHNTPTDVDMVC